VFFSVAPSGSSFPNQAKGRIITSPSVNISREEVFPPKPRKKDNVSKGEHF
jgi:hypothetical protein